MNINENEGLANNDNQDLSNEPANPDLNFREILQSKAEELGSEELDTQKENTPEATAEDKTKINNAEGKTPDVDKSSQENAQEPAEPVNKEVIDSPTSWNAELKQDWDKVPVHLQKHIIERENQIKEKINEANQHVHFSREIKQTLEPFNPLLQQIGTTPKEAISEVMGVAKIMYSGSELEKLQTIARMAQYHNIDLSKLFVQDDNVNNQLQMQHLQHQNQLRQQENQYLQQQYQQNQQQASNQQLNSVIEQFKVDKPDFESLRADMADIVPTILAKNPSMDNMQVLQMAYEQAKWLNPDIRQKQIEKQNQDFYNKQKEAEKQAIKQKANEKRNASFSLKNTGGQNSGNSNKKDMSFKEIMLEKAQAYNKQI